MKARLDIGAELDFLTKGELDNSLERAAGVWRDFAFGQKHFSLPVMRGNVTNGSLTLGSTGDPGQAGGQQVYCGPRQGWAWRVTRISVIGLASVPASQNAVSAAFAAAAAGSAVVPGGAALTGFDVTTAPPAAATATTVTVSNVVGGPLTYNVVETVASGGLLSIRFPVPLVASGGNATVAVAAAAGGAAGNITAYGTFFASSDSVNIYRGDPDASRFVDVLNAASPTRTPSQGLLLKPGDHLVVSGSSLGATQLTVSGEAFEAPANMMYKLIGR